MALKGNNLRYKMLPQGGKVGVINNSSIQTPVMVEPWRYGRQVGFLVTGTPAGTAIAGTMSARVNGRLRSDHATLVPLNGSDGNPWQLVPANIASGGIADEAASSSPGAFGNVDLSHFDGATYDGLCLVLGTTDAHNSTYAIFQFIFDLYQEPGNAIEDLFLLQPSPAVTLS